MEQFSPDLTDLYLTLAACALGCLGMVFLAWKVGNGKHPDPRRRVLLPMLSYFAALLLLMVCLGTFWSTMKFPDVAIGEGKMTIDGEEYPKPNLGSVRLENTGRGLGTDGRILLVQTRDRKNWAFPADRYDITRMYTVLRGE